MYLKICFLIKLTMVQCQGNGNCYKKDNLNNFIKFNPCEFKCELKQCVCCESMCPDWYINNPNQYCNICKSIGPKKRRLIQIGKSCAFCHCELDNQTNPKYDWEVKKMHRYCWEKWKKKYGIVDDSVSDDDGYSDSGDLDRCTIYVNYDIDIKNKMPDWTLNIIPLKEKINEQDKWRQEQMCVSCRKSEYIPIYSNGYRALCTNCFRNCKEKLIEIYDN